MFKILQEAGSGTRELEVRREGLERRAQAFRIGGVVAFLPVAVIARRIGEEQQANQEFETGQIQIGARPVRAGDSCVRNLVGTNPDGPVVPDCGNPRIRDEVEGQRVLSLLSRSRSFGDGANGSDIPRRGRRPGARDTRGGHLCRIRAGNTATLDLTAVRTHRYENVRPH